MVKKTGVTKDGLTCHSIIGVERHQKPSCLALPLPGGAQVPVFLLYAIFDCPTIFLPFSVRQPIHCYFAVMVPLRKLIEKSHNVEH